MERSFYLLIYFLWSSPMVIVHGDCLWSSSRVDVYGRRLGWSSTVVVYSRHLWSLAMVVICSCRPWSSSMVIVVYRHVCYTNRHTQIACLVQLGNLPLENYSCLAHEAIVSCSSVRSLSISATKPLCGRNSRSFISISRRRYTPVED
jgi:hypothetical protein